MRLAKNKDKKYIRHIRGKISKKSWKSNIEFFEEMNKSQNSDKTCEKVK